jgi:tRNA-dihydrouridine synthase
MMAPMAELSHRAFRELIKIFGGPDEYFTEMISAAGWNAGGPFEKYYGDAAPCPERVVFQLMGGDAEELARAAGSISRLPCKGIDVNMGCAAPAIIRMGAGVALMKDAAKAAAVAGAVRKQVKKRLSVKLRLGWTKFHNEEEDAVFERLVPFCRGLEEEGVELITLHPRTAKEKFHRSAHWKWVEALRRELHIPVAGNGDVTSAEEAAAKSGMADAVMIGRAAVQKPWIFAEIRGIREKPLNLEETGLRFLDLLAKYQPPEFQISRARRFFSYFCANLKWAHYVDTLINHEESLAGIEKVWKNWFLEHEEGE